MKFRHSTLHLVEGTLVAIVAVVIAIAYAVSKM